ncbi:hypothetical protein Pmani_018926 [Petrolisthes manimaculis]|uniref:DDE-1 domain-containing protein n=1 Tax=Petrolisthes manimaculis TaxID=1843537 RepID=A0AAE1PJ60_9EUCA|nr:hypothetical protein Pmani_018926 [Petrolisthes manimaculis]
MPGFKVAKDRLTLLLGGNVSGDFKLKPLLVYVSENPQALKNIAKALLPVVWKSNPKAWVTQALFMDWFYHHFIPEVEKYCRAKSLPFNVLLVLDNAPGHPPYLDDVHPNVKVVYMPPNTSSIIQPMNQGVIATFKKYYLRRIFSQALKATDNSEMTLREFWKSYNIYSAIKNINASWQEVTESCMNGVWKNLCPQFVNNFTGFEKVQEEVVNNLISMSEKLELDLNEDDFREFFDTHAQELTNDELRELEKQRKEVEEEEVEVPTKHFQTKLMAQAFALVDVAMAIFESQDINEERNAKVSSAVHDALKCYSVIYEEMRKAVTPLSLKSFFQWVDKYKETLPSTSQPVPSTSTTHTPKKLPKLSLTVPSSPITDDPSPTSSLPASPSTPSRELSPSPTNLAEQV